MTLIRSSGAQNTLKFHTGDDIGEYGIGVCDLTTWVIGLTAQGEDDSPNVDVERPICHIMDYSLGLTGFHALKTLTANPALKTTTSFSPCRFLVHGQIALFKAPYPFGYRKGGDLSTGYFRFLCIDGSVTFFRTLA
jgi:hypothetical protein